MRIVGMLLIGYCIMATSCNKNNGGTSSSKPAARFSVSGYEVAVPCVISFINISTNATSYAWDFGDGSTSTMFNPSHTYNFPGSYVLKLRVSGPEGADSVCKILTVDAPPAPNKSAFSYYQEKCSGVPVGISFKTINPLSTNPIWDFGNGNVTIDRDPIVSFVLRGDYTIKYSTLLSGVRDTVTRIIRIE